MKENAPKLGQIITGEAFRDAIHIAVAPVVAHGYIAAGGHIGLRPDGKATQHTDDLIGVADPFLTRAIQPGETFYMFLYPGTITGLRHEWSHPAFAAQIESPSSISFIKKSASEVWMRAWAVEHMAKDWENDDAPWSEDYAYSQAIESGHSHSVGNRENARDHIDNTWWDHWENITGCKGDRDEYFSCSC